MATMADDNYNQSMTIKLMANGTSMKINIQTITDEDDIEPAIDCFDDHYDVFDCWRTVWAFWKLCPEMFVVAKREDNGQVVGVCAAPIGPQNLAFVGLYGVRKEYRSAGLGSVLFQRCLLQGRKLTDNFGLYAVPEMRSKYFNLKPEPFQVMDGVSMVNFVGYPKNESLCNLEQSDSSVLVLDHLKNPKLLDSVIDYDQKIHCESRDKLLRLTLVPSSSSLSGSMEYEYLTVVAMDQSQKNVTGYGCVRQHSRTGRQLIGPLYADSPPIAQKLLERLILERSAQCRKYGICLYSLDSQPEALNLASQFVGLEEVERCQRLFTRQPLKANFPLIYAVFSPDFSL